LLAHHFTRAGAGEKALHYLERAGDHARTQQAHGAAEGYYRAALERLDGLGRAPEAGRLREKLGAVLLTRARYEEVLAVLEPAAETYRIAGDLEGLMRVTAALGRAHAMRGTAHEGLALLTALLERVERSGASPPPLATLHEALGWLLFTAGRYDASLAACERAAALAQATGDTRTLMLADAQRINILQLLGRFGEAVRVGQVVLPLAEGVADLGCVAQVSCCLAYIHALQGAFATSRRLLDRSVAAVAQMENPSRFSFTLAIRGWLSVLEGDWPGAQADLDRALAASRQADLSWYSSYPLVFRALLSLAEGAGDAATAAAGEALALSEGGGDLQGLRFAAGVLAEIEILEGRAEAARARLAPLLDRPGLEECDVTMLLPLLAWAHLELGQVEPAADTVEQALTRARPEEMRLVLVEALRVQTMVALRREQWEEAARSLEEGLARARALPYPYAEAQLLHLGGLLHLGQGEPEAARERLEAARAICARLGARRDLVHVEQALDALSHNDGLVV
jgi:tetratricopeptide (TPR) repeat protein